MAGTSWPTKKSTAVESKGLDNQVIPRLRDSATSSSRPLPRGHGLGVEISPVRRHPRWFRH
jgi:hypothetical protein